MLMLHYTVLYYVLVRAPDIHAAGDELTYRVLQLAKWGLIARHLSKLLYDIMGVLQNLVQVEKRSFTLLFLRGRVG